MEEYSDLKFDGDLSFLNENLDAAKNALSEEKIEEVKKEPTYNSNQPLPPTQQRPTENMEKYNDTMNSQNNVSNNRTENYSNSRNNQGMMNQSTSHYGEKKSQLEEMVLNSGYGPEMFNNLKMELLEMEKEKIIMKYKQDLMMMIIKS
jgi:hypothetical protein